MNSIHLCIYLLPLVQIHHWLTSITRAVYKHTQRASSLLCSWQWFDSFPGLQSVKTKAYRIRHYLYVRPHRPQLQAEASAWRQNKCMEFSLEKQIIGEKIDVTSEWLKHHLPRAYFLGDQERTMLVTRSGRSCLEESTILVGGYYYAGRRILMRWSVPLRQIANGW